MTYPDGSAFTMFVTRPYALCTGAAKSEGTGVCEKRPASVCPHASPESAGPNQSSRKTSDVSAHALLRFQSESTV